MSEPLPAHAIVSPSARTRRSSEPRPAAFTRARVVRRWWRRRPVKRALVLLHRWPALVLGLLLVVETTSGALLLYGGEYFRASHPNLYHHTVAAQPLGADGAIAVVAAAHPDFGAIWAARDKGVYAVGNVDYDRQWFVDPGTGHINGSGRLDGGVMGFLTNLHECALSCDGLPGHIIWLTNPVWAGGPTFLTGITWGAMTLGVLGLLTVLMVLTSLRIWWPGRRRLKQRLVVRRDKGRFAREYDLHNVIGAAALPFLLMWGVTGAAFEFPVVEKVWLSITGGHQPVDASYDVTPNPKTIAAPQLTLAQATDVALTKVPGRVSFVALPTKDAAYFEIDIVSGYGSQANRALYSGDTYVYIDAHDATNANVFDSGSERLPNRLYDKYLEPSHFGWNVNVWWRLIWLAFGLAPLALMTTGVSTWLFRRGTRKRRRAAAEAPLT